MTTKEKNRYQKDLQSLDNEIAMGIFALDNTEKPERATAIRNELDELYCLQGLVLEQLDMI